MVFDVVRRLIAEERGSWSVYCDAYDHVDNELGVVLVIGQELAPTLDTEIIGERIIKRDTNMSSERFGMELSLGPLGSGSRPYSKHSEA